MKKLKKKFDATISSLDRAIENKLKEYLETYPVKSNDLGSGLNCSVEDNLKTEHLKESEIKSNDLTHLLSALNFISEETRKTLYHVFLEKSKGLDSASNLMKNQSNQMKIACIKAIFTKIKFVQEIEAINRLLVQNYITGENTTVCLTQLLSSLACKIRFIEFIFYKFDTKNDLEHIVNFGKSCIELGTDLIALINHRFAENNRLHVKGRFCLPGSSNLLKAAAEINLDKEIVKFAKKKVADAKMRLAAKNLYKQGKETVTVEEESEAKIIKYHP